MQTSCLTGDFAGGVGTVCPTDESFCDIDPNCSISPYQREGPALDAAKVAWFTAAGFFLLIGALVFYFISAIRTVRTSAKAKFARAMATSMESESADELLKLFKEIDFGKDESGDGLVSRDELQAYVDANSGMSTKEFDALFKSIDTDGSAQIDFMEFCAFYGAMKRTTRKEAFADDTA